VQQRGFVEGFAGGVHRGAEEEKEKKEQTVKIREP
jgi:hypothetical protein